MRRCFMSPYLPKAKPHSTTPLVIATANEHHSVMMQLIVECGVDPVLNDDTHEIEKPDDNSPEEEVDVYENSGQNTCFGRLRQVRAMIMRGCLLR